MKNRIKYIIMFIIILLIEIVIGKYISGFIRNYIGDVLVIPCLYCLIRIVIPNKIKKLSLYVLFIGIFIELLQLFNITNLISGNNKLIGIILGGTFDIKDIICYIVGYLLIFFNNKYFCKKKTV